MSRGGAADNGSCQMTHCSDSLPACSTTWFAVHAVFFDLGRESISRFCVGLGAYRLLVSGLRRGLGHLFLYWCNKYMHNYVVMLVSSLLYV